MTEQTASSGKRAIDYAEHVLGVHSVANNAEAARNKLDETLTALSEERDKLNSVKDQITEIELEIIGDERGKHPDMAQTQMNQHVKIAFAHSGKLQSLKKQQREIESAIDGLQMDERMAEVDIKMCTARMIELGGYFQYLAIAKWFNEKGAANAPAVNQGPWDN
jgi:chromosome segregation ATPase